MAITAKQERNGVPGPEGTRGPQPGPYPAIPMAQAEAAGNANMTEGHALLDGLAGHTVSFDWESGLAIGEVPGEA